MANFKSKIFRTIFFVGFIICLTSPLAAKVNAASNVGNFNGDSMVDSQDLAILKTNWGKSGVAPSQGDTNNDTKVNIYDFSVVVGNWSKTDSTLPWANAGPDPGTTFTNSAPLLLDNVHDMVYENIRFSGSTADAESGVIQIKHATYNITFRNCIIETNGNGVGNGVTILDTGWGIHDITFDHCRFAYQPRMGIEIISRRVDRGAGNFPGYQRVNITNSIFEAQGSEAISYDDDDPSHVYNSQSQGAGNSTISGNYVKGAGINPTYSWRRTFEINRTRNMTITNNYFGPGVDGISNLRQTLGDPSPVNWNFSGNTWDATTFVSGVTYKAGAQIWYMANVQAGVKVSDSMTQSAPYSAGSWGYLDSVSNADFSGSTVHGMPGQLSSGMSPNSSNILWPSSQ